MNEMTEALLEGASALRYKAERLSEITGPESVREMLYVRQIELWFKQSKILADLAKQTA